MSHWFIITRQFEADLTKYFLNSFSRNSNCVNVGANFGYYTCLMARFCPDGKVIGIEADRHVFELTRDNIYINGFHHAKAINAAVSDRVGEATLYRRSTRSGNTSITKANRDLTDLLGEPQAEAFTVKSVRVDDLLPEFDGRLDFVKVDIEGAEPLPIRGSTRAVKLNPQISIVTEWSPGQIQGAGFDLSDFLRRSSQNGPAGV